MQNLSSSIKTFDGLGDVPGIEELKLGEIGINTQDGRLYIKRAYDGVETIVEIGAGGGGGDLNATTTFNAYIYTSDGTLETITGMMMQVTYYSMIQTQILRHEFKYI